MAFPRMETTSDERLWAAGSHILPLIVPALGIVGPVVVYVIRKDVSKFVAFHALQSILFQLALYVIAVLVGTVAVLTCVGVVLIAPVVVLGIVYPVIAAIKSFDSELFEFPWIGTYARQQVFGG